MTVSRSHLRQHASTVQISASEATDLIPESFDPETAWFYHLGDANAWVSNISPHDGGVEFYLHVNFHAPLNIVVDIIVLDPHEQFHLERQ
ncbi:hypothetical protein [Ktedonobacter racemifer]|uniref:Uncharacterized protein n=1 Tax=Ktedonobacter racemifer DSM 44963 TaxID=485913 RepID=D6U704_KTERA|nr:hypothetical protein [Ktedonobacter racemifer]EFH79665.1 hypothetical protein Krac_0143 [Ktedonobacter racemifer DSM 44963]